MTFQRIWQRISSQKAPTKNPYTGWLFGDFITPFYSNVHCFGLVRANAEPLEDFRSCLVEHVLNLTWRTDIHPNATLSELVVITGVFSVDEEEDAEVETEIRRAIITRCNEWKKRHPLSPRAIEMEQERHATIREWRNQRPNRNMDEFPTPCEYCKIVHAGACAHY